jgi:hypothetical protein
MDNNNPMQSITEQFDVVFDKAIAEIEQEEAALENQIRQLTEKKMALGRRRELLTDLRPQVENLTEGIRAADEQYEAEIKKKEELDAEIQQTANTLAHLKDNRQETETRVDNAENEKRAKHKQLAQMRAQFGESVIESVDEVVTGLEQTVIDIGETESPASIVESGPAIAVSPIPDEEPILANNASPLSADLTPDDAKNEVEDAPERSESIPEIVNNIDVNLEAADSHAEITPQPDTIPETANIDANLAAEEIEFVETPSEDSDNEIAESTPQPQTLPKTLDETGNVKQLFDPDHSDDQMPTGAIDVDFDELTHDEAEEDEASEAELLHINEVEIPLSTITPSDPETDEKPSDEDDAIDVDFDELLSPEELAEKQTVEETPPKRGNAFTRHWKHK